MSKSFDEWLEDSSMESARELFLDLVLLHSEGGAG